jgi:rhodanese-related sulfurtransferase
MNPNNYDLLPSEFAEALRNSPDATLLDVRTPEEYEQGHLPGAINMNVQSYDFAEEIENLDPHKPCFVYCKGGARSMMAYSILKDHGFDEVYNMRGGIMAWYATEGLE